MRVRGRGRVAVRAERAPQIFESPWSALGAWSRPAQPPRSYRQRGRRATIPGNVEPVGEVTYVSRIRIKRLGGPQRLAYLPAEDNPVAFGVHSEVAQHYGVDPGQYPPHATTLDYVVAATGG